MPASIEFSICSAMNIYLRMVLLAVDNFCFIAACAKRPGCSHYDFESISANLHQRVVIYYVVRQVISGEDLNVQVDVELVYFQHHKQLEEVAANAFLHVEQPFDLNRRSASDLALHIQAVQKKSGEHCFCG